MSDINNLKKVSWTSPSGTIFDLKTLSNEYSRKHIGEVRENAKENNSKDKSKKVQDSNDTFSDLGLGGRDITLECFFIGQNHYSEAEKFISALGELGKSTLQLAYGSPIGVNVLNFTVKNDLIKNINSTTVSVSFHETSKTTYPASEASKTKEVKNAGEESKTNISQNLDNTVKSISSQSRLSSFSTNFKKALSKVSAYLDVANNVSLNSIMTDILSQTPANNMFTMANELGLLFYKAANAAGHIKNEISNFSLIPQGSIYGQWSNLINGLISSTLTDGITPSQNEIDNLFINDSIAQMALVSLSQSLIEKEYETRSEAIEAAKILKELEKSWTEHIEEQIAKIEELSDFIIRDNSLENIVDITSCDILEKSYELKVEKTVILSESMTIPEIAYLYYREDFEENPDDTIDYLIRTNQFSDEEFYLIERGSAIKIYV